MLVLSRREGERILIGENVWVMVVKGGDHVKIGIDAPRGVPIRREEITSEEARKDWIQSRIEARERKIES